MENYTGLIGERVKIFDVDETDPNKYVARGVLEEIDNDGDGYFIITNFRFKGEIDVIPRQKVEPRRYYILVKDESQPNNDINHPPASPMPAAPPTWSFAHPAPPMPAAPPTWSFAHPAPPMPAVPLTWSFAHPAPPMPAAPPFGGTLPTATHPAVLSSGVPTPIFNPAPSSTNGNLQPLALASMFNNVANADAGAGAGAGAGPLAPTAGASTIYPGLPATFDDLSPEQYAALLASIPPVPPSLSHHGTNNSGSTHHGTNNSGSARRSSRRRTIRRKRRRTMNARRRHRRS